jgi:hypothetical protein
MGRYRPRLVVLAAIAPLAMTNGCHAPVIDQAQLRAVRLAAGGLMTSHPAKPPLHYQNVSQSQWPQAIADLKPERVVVREWGVDIVTKSYFDGGWGYHIAARRRDLPMPSGCYSEISRGIFWHGPC